MQKHVNNPKLYSSNFKTEMYIWYLVLLQRRLIKYKDVIMTMLSVTFLHLFWLIHLRLFISNGEYIPYE